MAGILQHLRSSTLDKRPNPASMVDGQIAINYASGAPGMFFKNSNGDLVKVGPVHVGSSAPNASPASGGTAGNSIGEQWLDNSGGTYVFKIWDGSAWRSEAGEFVNTTGDTMTGALILPSGTAAAPALGVGSTNNGLYSPGADQVAISTNGTERVEFGTSEVVFNDGGANYDFRIEGDTKANLLFVDSSADQVGVGTNANGSNARLEVKSTTGSINSATLRLNSSDTTTGAVDTGSTILLSGHDGSVSGRDFASIFGAKENSTSGNYASYLAFGTRTNGGAVSERLRITSDGKLGLGTSSPNATLDITNGGLQLTDTSSSFAASEEISYFHNTNTQYAAIQFTPQNASQGYIYFKNRVGSTLTDVLTIQGSNVGIGTTSPGAALQIDSGNAFSTLRLNNTAGGTSVDLGATSAGDFAIRTGATEAARIDSSGRLGLGTSSPGQQMVVRGSQPFLEIRDSRTGNWSGGDVFSGILFGTDDTTTAVDPHAFIKAVHTRAGSGHSSADAGLTFGTSASTSTPATERMRIDDQGRVGIGTTSPSEKLDINVSSTIGFSIGDDPADSTKLALRSYQGSTNNNVRSISYIGSDHRFQVGAVTGTTASEAARIDNDGRLLVGTSSWSGSNLVTIQGNTSNSTGGGELFLARGASAGTILENDLISRISFGDKDDNDYARIECLADGSTASGDYPGRLVFSTTADGASSPTERMRITSDAYIRLASGTGGIQFNGDTAAANALDDYEEGTWTPTSQSGSYAAASGTYTKIGRVVTLNFSVTFPASGMTGNARLNGIPFSVTQAGSSSTTTDAGIVIRTEFDSITPTAIRLADSAGVSKTENSLYGKTVSGTLTYFA